MNARGGLNMLLICPTKLRFAKLTLVGRGCHPELQSGSSDAWSSNASAASGDSRSTLAMSKLVKNFARSEAATLTFSELILSKNRGMHWGHSLMKIFSEFESGSATLLSTSSDICPPWTPRISGSGTPVFWSKFGVGLSELSWKLPHFCTPPSSMRRYSMISTLPVLKAMCLSDLPSLSFVTGAFTENRYLIIPRQPPRPSPSTAACSTSYCGCPSSETIALGCAWHSRRYCTTST
mmetsp:Transcript_98926/g.236026  ORF Transcript_98926/g.236026 Transcript_98926/m.236026 type:complete len:236 (+) Transcript_98926:1520-2227(+)